MAVKTNIPVERFDAVEIEGAADSSEVHMRFSMLERTWPDDFGTWQIDYDLTEAKKVAYAILMAVADIEGRSDG